MKKLILTAFIFASFLMKIKACSWSSEDEAFYNLFNQELVSDKSLHPFLLTYDYAYYTSNYWNPASKSEDSIDYNILEWKKYFDNKITESDLKYLVYKSTIEELNFILSNKKDKTNTALNNSILSTDKGIEAIKYLIFAKQCEKFALTQSNESGWSYMGAREQMTKPQFMQTAKDGNQLYAATQNNDIKLRIAYQLVRLSHYGGFNDDAVRYFNTYVEPLKNKSLLYYYALEQKAGALYNQKKYAMAAQNYLQVFNATPDRQLAVYASFAIGENLYTNAENLLKTADEKSTLYLLRGYNNFSSGVSEMKKIYNIAPNSTKLELLAVREMNKTERKVLEQPYQGNNKTMFLKPDANTTAYLQKLILFTETLLNNKQVIRKDFWKAYQAHLYFLSGKYDKAQSIAKSIQSNETNINNQATITAFAAYTAALKTIDDVAETTINNFLTSTKDENTQRYIYEIVAHKYLLQNNFAKAFLCHNDLSGLYTSLDIKIIDDLIAFYNKTDKNNLENKLADKQKDALVYLYDLKGTHYLKMDDLNNAIIWFKKVPTNLAFLKQHEYDYETNTTKEIEGEFNGYSDISARIFSNGVRSYFEDSEEKAMTDEVYKMPEFKFITSKMNKLQLVENLLKLKKIAEEKSEAGARANYLLGNYYYNTSSWGFYRNIMYYEPGNYYLSYIYKYGNTEANSLKSPYNYNGGTGVTFVNNLQKPYDYYMKVEGLSAFSELKAKAIFQASKIELDIFFAKQADTYFGYNGNYKQLYSKTNRPLFAVLKQKYADTKYYKEIQSNCLYFKYYLNQ